MKKMIAYVTGAMGGLAVLAGIVTLIAPKAVVVVLAIVMICLSLAFGIIIPNPFSVAGFVAGICMLLFPSAITGATLLIIGSAVVISNIFISRRCLKLY